MTTHQARRCPACREATLQSATRERRFHPHGRELVVELLVSRCPACGAEATSAAQHAENLKRLASRKADYGELLLGEEILALRRRYGITQQAASTLFGKGKIAFSRYENETSYPDASTTKLLALALEKPGVMRALADKAGIKLPLWEARSADERQAKVCVIAKLNKTSAKANSWLVTSRAEHNARAGGSARARWVEGCVVDTRTTAVNETHYFGGAQSV